MGGGYSFVYSSYDYVNVHGDPISNKCKIKENVKYKDLLTKTYISTPTVLYDRNFYGNVKMPLRRTGQDYAFWLTLLKSGNAFGIDEVLVHVTKRGDSLSKNKFQSLKDVYETQIELEHIGKTRVTFNVIRYCIYAVTKKLGMRFV